MKVFCQCNLISRYSARFCACLFLLTIGAGSVYAQEKNNEIIAFGDSITVGLPEQSEYDPAEGRRVGGYEPDLELLTDARDDHYNVYNFGWGGEITLNGLQRFLNELARYPNAKYVLILEGTNDIWSGLTREDTVYNLRMMVQKAKVNAGMIPIIGTLTPDPRNNGKDVPLYNQMIKQMAVEENVAVADLYAEMIDDWETTYIDVHPDVPSWTDWLHPNRAGYAKMAEVWFDTVFACSTEYLDQCGTEPECTDAGGYWSSGMCTENAPFPGGVLLLLLNSSP